jgi:hypothetical protein
LPLYIFTDAESTSADSNQDRYNECRICTAFTEKRYLQAAVPWRPVLSKLEAFAKQEAL